MITGGEGELIRKLRTETGAWMSKCCILKRFCCNFHMQDLLRESHILAETSEGRKEGQGVNPS